MRITGLLINIGGWVIAMSGLFISTSNGVRLCFACAGIAVSIFGILGVMNKFYLQRAIWKQ